jgi:TolA-binding protein
MREDEMTIEELAELDLSKYVYKVERKNKQLKADMVSKESEYEDRIKELTSRIEKLKLDHKDTEMVASTPENQSKLDRLKQGVLKKNKLIGDLRAQVGSMSEKIQTLSKRNNERFISNQSKDHSGLPEHVPVRLERILKGIEEKPRENTEQGINTQVVSYITRKNAILSSRCREL